ncbi:hypothetical protein A2U01_0064540, partial [Trifolium medium]|nr:hypothetical protein [Trifolium medium]
MNHIAMSAYVASHVNMT